MRKIREVLRLHHACGLSKRKIAPLFEDGYYLGVFDSVADYVQEITEETTEIPDHLRGYIDYESMARDMELNGDIFTVELEGDVHIFANR